MSDILQEHHDSVNVVFALNDRMAEGVSEAYKEWYPEYGLPTIIGVDATYTENGSLKLISDGVISASCLYPTGGDSIIDVARNILYDNSFERETVLKTAIVDQSNVRLYTLQVNQILEKTQKISALNSRISTNLIYASRQRTILYVMVLLVLVSLFFLSYVVLARRKEKLLNGQLSEQNTRIKAQVADLEVQKQQLQELSDSLEETTQAKLTFYTNISHEFKTPLTLISGPINDLMEMPDLSQEARKKVDIVFRNSSKLTRLITELLDFRRYEKGKMAPNYSIGDLKAFLESIIGIFSDIISRRGISFSFECEDGDYIIPFDSVKMEKMFTNLMSNAFNHVNKSGTIRVCLSRKNVDGYHDEMELSVFNSGSYIPESERENIFQRFYSLDGEQRGTGIGLALITSIVNALDGKISLESDEKKGTAFIVTFPVKDNSCTDASVNPKTYEAGFAWLKRNTIGEEEPENVLDEADTGTRPSVLVIEDNYDMRLYIRDILSTDYHVMTAKDGDEGINKALKYAPQLILCDIMMPVKDGFEVCTALRKNKITENVPIILLTACSMDEQIAKGYECGADSYLQKPFSVRTLRIRMEKLLEKDKKIRSEIAGDWLIGRDASKLTTSASQLLSKVKTYVEERLRDEINIDDLVKYLGCSKSKFYRDLKEVTDYTTVDIINLVRLRKAIDLMVHAQESITDAAYSCGFSSSSYFSRTFAKYYNERPSDYIKRVTATNQD